MPRRERAARRLVVGDATYLWSVGHRHHTEEGTPPGCAETLRLRRDGAHGSVLITFRGGPGRSIPDGYGPSGGVGAGDAYLNLHEPGSARAMLDEVLAQGWDPTDPSPRVRDGWDLLPAAAARREPSRDA